MFLLPKGKPLAENVPIAKLQLPDALEKLKNSRLTGCATFDFHNAHCILIYEDGNLISALLCRDKSEQKDADVLPALVDLMVLADSGIFNVYSFSKGVNQAVLALVRGNRTISNKELKQIDFKALIDEIKNEQMTATLKISTDERIGMIFYQDGATVGFFHDNAHAIETSAGEVHHIAALPGASVDLFALKGHEPILDLVDLVHIRSMWDTAKGDVFTIPKPVSASQPLEAMDAPTPPPATCSADIENAIISVANFSLGKLGKTIVEKELAAVGGIKALKDGDMLGKFLNAVEKSSKLLASTNKIAEMSTAISSEVAKL